MSTPTFGIINIRPETEVRPVLGADFSKIGIVTTSEDANAQVLPTMTALRFTSFDPTLLAGCGTGLLADAIRGINDQLGDLQAAADLIIVRVAVGVSADETLQNVVDGLQVLRNSPHEINATPRLIICPGYTGTVSSYGGTIDVTPTASRQGGNHGTGTLTLAATPWGTGVKSGIYKVEIDGGSEKGTSAAKLGNTGTGVLDGIVASIQTPVGVWKVICGIVKQSEHSIWTVLRPDGSVDGLAEEDEEYISTLGLHFKINSKAEGGADYDLNDEFDITVVKNVPTGSTGATFTVQAPDSTYLTPGVVGTPYVGQVNFTMAMAGQTDFEVGDGWHVTVLVTDPIVEANPVIAALPEILSSLLAVAFVDSADSNQLAAENWRETVLCDRIIATGVNVRVFEDANIVARPTSPRVAGLAVKVDQLFGGLPFNPIANRPIYGIVGTTRNIAFSLTDGACEGQELLAADIGIIVRGELGVDTAIADSGFVYIGTDSCSDPSDLWSQFHQVRGADWITVAMMKLTRQFLGRAITADLAEAWINSIKFMLRDRKANNDILGYKVEFIKDLNSPEEIRLGHLTVTPHIEPAPVFKRATHQIMRWRPAIDALVADIISRLNASG